MSQSFCCQVRLGYGSSFATRANSKKSPTVWTKNSPRVVAIKAVALPSGRWKRVAIPRPSDHPSFCSRPAQSVGVSHRYGDGLAVEVLRDAIGARDIRRHELTLHAHADGMNRPSPWDRSRQIGNDSLDELLCY